MNRNSWVLLVWVLWVVVITLFFFKADWQVFSERCSEWYPEGWRVAFTNACPQELMSCSVPYCYSALIENPVGGGVV